MKCQNCGFESEGKICNVCGAEIVEIKEEKQQITEFLVSNEESRTETAEVKIPKRSIKKILLFALIIVLSVAVVSASSIAVFNYCTNDDRISFSKINQALSFGNFSVKLKEVKTPEFKLNYYPQITYDLVFELHNNTSRKLTLYRPEITDVFTIGGGYGYMNLASYGYEVNGKRDVSIYLEIPAWSSVEITECVYYEDYSDDYLSVITSSKSSDAVGGNDESDNSNNSSEYYKGDGDENDSVEDDSGDEGENTEDELLFDMSKIKYKKENLEKYKEDSPDSFYLVLANRELDLYEERRYARFFVEPDKDAIVIPESKKIE